MNAKNKDISILVVDDEEMIVTILLNFLGEKGYDVTGINDPAEAIELVKQRKFDVVFTDLMMPVINGMELVKEISGQGVDTQIVIFTGYASVDSAIDAVQQGVYDYIKKPFRLEDIDNILQHALEQLMLERENLALHNKIKRMLSQITMLYDISNIIYQVREKKYAVEMLFDTLSETMQIHTALLCERGSSETEFKAKFSSRKAEGFKDIFNFSIGSKFNQQSLSADEPTILDNVGSQIELDADTLKLPDECERIILVPIKFQGEIESYLVIIEHKDYNHPFEDELTLLKILATQIAPILGSKKKRPKNLLESKAYEPARAMHQLIKAELSLSEVSGTPVSFAMARLVASGHSDDQSDFSIVRESWRNKVAAQLGPEKRLHWAGIDTLLILAVGGNPVGLDHHLANVRHEVENTTLDSGTNSKFSMAYSILTYPFDADSAKKISAKLSSRLFYDASEIKFNQ